VNKTAIEQIFDLSSFRRGAASSTSAVGLAAQSPQPISINDCTWSESGSRGSVSNARQSFEWDLQFKPEDTGQRAPEKSGTWVKLGQRLPRGASAAIKRQLWSADPSLIDLRVSGTFRVNGEIFSLSEAPGAIGHTSGGRLPHTWVWSQGSAFLNERGTRVGFAFEGMALRERLFGKLAGPSATNLYFLYQDQPYFFHSAQSPLTVRSEVSLSSWSFSAEAGDLTFRGESRADFRDFAGMTLEDTNGSFIHLATTLVSDIEIRVYRRSKIEAAFYANGIGTLEFAERSKNPYVPKLI
jgi:hypothetical protein